MTRRIRTPSLALLAVVALALGACGQEDVLLEGHSEGSYLDVGPVQYQVQMSRLLNPADREDAGYLVGVPDSAQLADGEAWFAVFMRAENESDDPQPLAEHYAITDSVGNEFEPVELPDDNVFALRATSIPGGEAYPLLGSPAAETTIQGALVLFKIPYANFDNRPLELEISSAELPDVVASVDLDV